MEKYTLIITEKPDAAFRIASALHEKGRPEECHSAGTPYYVARNRKKILVVPALGHLYTVAPDGKSGYPIFSFRWKPRHEVEKSLRRMRFWLETITELAKGADDFIDACDYDMEGSVIGYSVLKFACGNKDKVSRRMKYSTLTPEELKHSFNELLPKLDFALIEAGCTRHEVDWLYGINLSRALTTAAKKSSGAYMTISTGRVQGPTLKFLVARERTIRSFVPVPYWEIKAIIEIDQQACAAAYEKKIIETKREAKSILEACKGKDGVVEKISFTRYDYPPPLPFDLGALQREAYRIFGYTPKRTSSMAQRLYVDALISYPRTSSQKLPKSIGYETILKNLTKDLRYSRLAEEILSSPKLSAHEGRGDDPAHPAIYPTGKLPDRALGCPEAKILDLVIRRFMAVFAQPAARQTATAKVDVEGYHFYLTGRQTLKQGWLHFYKPFAACEETRLPSMEEGKTVKVKEVILLDRFTNPPARFNPSSLLKKMEVEQIGTKATRADIIQTLQDRKYVQGQAIIVTDLGFEVTEVLEDNCPTVVSTKLTRELEEKMNRIRQEAEKKENVLAQTIEILKPALNRIKRKERRIGEKLGVAIRKIRIEERIVGKCPTCKTGNLMIILSRKTGKRFMGCSNYFKGLCKTSFPIPQYGIIRTSPRSCIKCGWPIIQVQTKARRPWNLCLNPKCQSKRSGEQS